MDYHPLTQEEAEDFVRLWQSSRSGQAVADRLGLSRQRVHQIAEKMRLAGIPLKRGSYDRKRQRMENNWDVEKLKRILDEERGPINANSI